MFFLKFFQQKKKSDNGRGFQLGTTLIEILIATAILGLVMTSIVAIITLSIKDAAEAKEKAVAVKYGQEGMEFFRRERQNLGWESYVKTLQDDGAGSISYCLPTIPADDAGFAALTPGACSTANANQYVDSRQIFQRQADIVVTNNGGVLSASVNVTIKIGRAHV